MDQPQPIQIALGPLLSDGVLAFVPDHLEDVAHGGIIVNFDVWHGVGKDSRVDVEEDRHIASTGVGV